MLDFRPQRIGHACFFEDEHWRQLKSTNIPVEICLTSNVRTMTVPSIDVHHFAHLYNAKHPLVLCTDDSGVFSTCLSKEYKIAADSFAFLFKLIDYVLLTTCVIDYHIGLGRREMFELSRNAVEYIFADSKIKEDLRRNFNSVAKKYGSVTTVSS
ncbi:Adenosine deaminase-like protein [Glycine soja]